MPTSRALCTRPKILPRLLSLVRSAIKPLQTGRREAKKKPLMPRKNIITQKFGTKAKMVMATPSPMAPSIRMVFLFKVPRSARIPQKGAAKFVRTICTVNRTAKWPSCNPKSRCKANWQAGTNWVSIPSRALTQHSQKRMRVLGSRSSCIWSCSTCGHVWGAAAKAFSGRIKVGCPSLKSTDIALFFVEGPLGALEHTLI